MDLVEIILKQRNELNEVLKLLQAIQAIEKEMLDRNETILMEYARETGCDFDNT